MTNCETFYDADRECANMFPPQCDTGDICEKIAIVLAVLATA
jgi:hypothetical protein